MIFKPRQLSLEGLDGEALAADKKKCRRFGPCGVGEKALYLNSFYIDRCFYVTLSSVRRVFKRVAMSKGGFTGKGMFASIPYLVVGYAGGGSPPGPPPTQRGGGAPSGGKGGAGGKALSQGADPPGPESLGGPGEGQGEAGGGPRPLQSPGPGRPDQAQQRPVQSRLQVGGAALLLGPAGLVYGVWTWVNKNSTGVYFLLFGMAAIFFFSGANVLPTARNNKKAVAREWEAAKADLQEFLSRSGKFPVPYQYAHPIVLERMIRILREGRAQTSAEALEVLKKDLQALNASVQVEQEEYDEVVCIKPMFLLENYQ